MLGLDPSMTVSLLNLSELTVMLDHHKCLNIKTPV